MSKFWNFLAALNPYNTIRLPPVKTVAEWKAEQDAKVAAQVKQLDDAHAAYRRWVYEETGAQRVAYQSRWQRERMERKRIVLPPVRLTFPVPTAADVFELCFSPPTRKQTMCNKCNDQTTAKAPADERRPFDLEAAKRGEKFELKGHGEVGKNPKFIAYAPDALYGNSLVVQWDDRSMGVWPPSAFVMSPKPKRVIQRRVVMYDKRGTVGMSFGYLPSGAESLGSTLVTVTEGQFASENG